MSTAAKKKARAQRKLVEAIARQVMESVQDQFRTIVQEEVQGALMETMPLVLQEVMSIAGDQVLQEQRIPQRPAPRRRAASMFDGVDLSNFEAPGVSVGQQSHGAGDAYSQLSEQKNQIMNHYRARQDEFMNAAAQPEAQGSSCDDLRIKNDWRPSNGDGKSGLTEQQRLDLLEYQRMQQKIKAKKQEDAKYFNEVFRKDENMRQALVQEGVSADAIRAIMAGALEQ